MIDYRLLKIVEENECYRQCVYQCSADKNTIGIGFNLDDVGLSLDESRVILKMRLEHISESLHNELPWLYEVGKTRISALCDMAYQMGITGLLGFKKSLALMESGDYYAASVEFLNSNWARQTPARAHKITGIISSGEYP